jgi:ketosteroid isomerase-like protein
MNIDSNDTVLDCELQRYQGLLAGDVAALEALLSDTVVYVHSTGEQDTKSSYIEKIANGRLRYLELAFENLNANSHENWAFVSGRLIATVRKDGLERNVRSLFMTIWAKESDGSWRLQAHQGTAVPH